MTAARASGHVPLRRCVACRTARPQEELIRFARDGEGNWKLDLARRAGGRGAWLCRDEACWSRKSLGRAFRAQAVQVAQQLQALESSKEHNLGRVRERPRDGGIDV